MKKVCFVVQRYGTEINGGAEYLCRLYAERLQKYYDVEVVTSCATDYITWKNEYQEGKDQINGVTVWRFPCLVERDMDCFDRESNIYLGNKTRDFYDDFRWLKLNGPECPGIFRFIKDQKENFDSFIFMGYLYYSTTFCLPEVSEKSILISTAHNELPLNACGSFHALFNLPAGFIFLTQAERRFVHGKFRNSYIPYIVTGSGITLHNTKCDVVEIGTLLEKFHIGHKNYVVYIGRIEPGKSCDLLFDHFIEYKNRYGGDTKLVLVGKVAMEIPKRDDIIVTGFVKDEEKYALLQHAKVMVMPSRQESLCIAVLEAMASGIPVFVNAYCDVLKEHILESNAGLYFSEKAEFVEALYYLLEHPHVCKRLGENGKKYVETRYEWESIDRKIIGLIERTASHERN